MEERKVLRPNPLCEKCRSRLILGSKFKRNDNWQALEIMSLTIMIIKAVKENKYHIKYGNDPMCINQIQCLGCFVPDAITEIIEIAKKDKTLSTLNDFAQKERVEGVL